MLWFIAQQPLSLCQRLQYLDDTSRKKYLPRAAKVRTIFNKTALDIFALWLSRSIHKCKWYFLHAFRASAPVQCVFVPALTEWRTVADAILNIFQLLLWRRFRIVYGDIAWENKDKYYVFMTLVGRQINDELISVFRLMKWQRQRSPPLVPRTKSHLKLYELRRFQLHITWQCAATERKRTENKKFNRLGGL